MIPVDHDRKHPVDCSSALSSGSNGGQPTKRPALASHRTHTENGGSRRTSSVSSRDLEFLPRIVAPRARMGCTRLAIARYTAQLPAYV